jgi:hypothetical protein
VCMHNITTFNNVLHRWRIIRMIYFNFENCIANPVIIAKLVVTSALSEAAAYTDALIHDYDVVVEPEVQCYADGTYTPKLRQCIYEFLENNVSSICVEPIIKAVLGLVGKFPSQLPHRTTIHRMNIERLALAQKQLIELVEKNTQPCILMKHTKAEKNIMVSISEMRKVKYFP